MTDNPGTQAITPHDDYTPRILVTGATGYVGGRLVPCLLEKGYLVRVMTRDERHLKGRSWLERVEVVEGDVLEPESLEGVMDNVDAAYYLIHSMSAPGDFYERDMHAAENFAAAAEKCNVQRIIYLGGLGDENDELSEHLRSRQKVGDVLRRYEVQVTEFRAAVVVGAGSSSFEMIRYLTERLPVMIAPKWLFTQTQPIGIYDTLEYLVAALSTPASADEIIEIGGSGKLNYLDMMLLYAEARGLRRYVIPVPVMTPRLSSLWVHLVTPVPYTLIQPLVQGLLNEMVVRDDKAEQLFPEIAPGSYVDAVHGALDELEASSVETTWTDSMAATWEEDEPYVFTEERGMMIERRKRTVEAEPEAIYNAFSGLGGETGWLYLNWLWHLRGVLDRIVGGPGYRRGRRNEDELRPGDVVDFWRVEDVETNKKVLLRAEMRTSGRAWLAFEIEPHEEPGKWLLVQTAYYAPKGLFGFLYWYALFIPHLFIFDGMIDRVVERAEGRANLAQSRRLPRVAVGSAAVAAAVTTAIVSLLLRVRD